MATNASADMLAFIGETIRRADTATGDTVELTEKDVERVARQMIDERLEKFHVLQEQLQTNAKSLAAHTNRAARRRRAAIERRKRRKKYG